MTPDLTETEKRFIDKLREQAKGIKHAETDFDFFIHFWHLFDPSPALHMIAHAIEALSAPPEDGWISVADRLPEPYSANKRFSTNVLVTDCQDNGYGEINVRMGYYGYEAEMWLGNVQMTPTHWMKILPAPPKINNL